jgi:hypothetical protein
VAQRDTQLRPAEEKAGDNNGRNLVRPQTQEPYGDQELAAESQVHFHHHFAGQPLETVADREANEALRAEQYDRARVDPLYRHAQKIDMPDEDKVVRMRDVAVPLLGQDELDALINEAEQAYEHDEDDRAADADAADNKA